MNEEVLRAAAAALDRGEPAALITVVRVQGSTPQRAGAKMLVFRDGRSIGTVGGGCYENEAVLRARRALDEGSGSQLLHFELNDDFAQENGLICGGRMDVHIDPLLPDPRLYVIGAGHVGFQLGRIAPDAGFRVHVVDDREKFANAERFPNAEITVQPIPDWLHRSDIPAAAFVVVVTRGHQHDLDAMRALAARDLRYLGLIGSRAKVARIYDALLAEGLPSACLERIHAPIGLEIGAVTPAEIAVSILAELIAVRRGADVSQASMKRLSASALSRKNQQA